MPDTTELIEKALEENNGTGLDPAIIEMLTASADGPAVEIIVPLAFFTAIVVTICAIAYLRFRRRQDVQTTIRAAIERGQELTPEILERLGEATHPQHRDLRRGVVAVGTGAGIAAFGLLVGEEGAVQPLIAIGALPFLIGLAYIGLWYFTGREK